LTGSGVSLHLCDRHDRRQRIELMGPVGFDLCAAQYIFAR
jgi:hypothetical protein